MLAFVEGRVVEIPEDGRIVVRVGDFGIAAQIPHREVQSLQPGEEVRIYTLLHFSPQESKPALYGFLRAEERDVFELLLKSPGVGPKVAMALLELDPAVLVSAIENEQLAVLTGIPGVGTKTAQRLVLELQGKFKELAEKFPEAAMAPGVQGDVADALKGLGFSSREISGAIIALKGTGVQVEQLPLDELLRLGLEQLRR